VNTITVPVHADDKLREMPDEKVHNIERGLKGKIETLRRKNVDTKELEVEYCYVKRELEHRMKRHELQRRFAQQRAERAERRNRSRGPRPAHRSARPIRPDQVSFRNNNN
jgi:hypothetical protein